MGSPSQITTLSSAVIPTVPIPNPQPQRLCASIPVVAEVVEDNNIEDNNVPVVTAVVVGASTPGDSSVKQAPKMGSVVRQVMIKRAKSLGIRPTSKNLRKVRKAASSHSLARSFSGLSGRSNSGLSRSDASSTPVTEFSASNAGTSPQIRKGCSSSSDFSEEAGEEDEDRIAQNQSADSLCSSVISEDRSESQREVSEVYLGVVPRTDRF